MRNKMGRNDFCYCGSGIKYKKCCLKNEQIVAQDPYIQDMLQQEDEDEECLEALPLEVSFPNIKISEMILELARDKLLEVENRAEERGVIQLTCIAWNLAIVKKESQEEYQEKLNLFLEDMDLEDKDGKVEVRSLLEEMVDKKLKQYPEIDRPIFNYEIKFKKNGMLLGVATLDDLEQVESLLQSFEDD